MTEKVARVLMAHGEKAAAIDPLRKLGFSQRLNGDPFSLRLLEKALWKLGAADEGRALLQQAAAGYLASEPDLKEEIPWLVAREQSEIDDREGARET